MKIRTATIGDLSAINAIAMDAIDTWQVAARVKQLSRHAYQYDASDLNDGEIRIMIDLSDQAIGFAHWSRMDATRSAVLHGLYLGSASHRQGLGRQLLNDTISRARQAGLDSLTLRAQRDAEPFFHAQGFEPEAREPLPPLYPRRMAKRLRPPDSVRANN